MSDKLPQRSAIPVELTWNLADLFPDEAAYATALQDLAGQADKLEQAWRGRIAGTADPSQVLAAIRELERYEVSLSRAGNYAYLAFAVDMADEAGAARNQQFEALAADLDSRLSFLSSELMAVSGTVLDEAARLDPAYAAYIDDIRRRQKHRLEPESEKVLAALAPALQLPLTVYEQTKHADMDFGTFPANGRTYPLSYVLFENDYSLESNAGIRRGAFRAFSAKLAQYQNTVATIYNGEVQKQKIIARLRGFNSVFDYLLDGQKVDRTLYDRQIDIIMTGLAPVMRRYAELLRRAHGLDRMTFADLKIALDPDFDPRVSIEDSRRYISDALSVLGRDYHDLVLRAYPERWVDFARNKGKSTGGFCSTPYDSHAFILLSWTGRLSEVFTLAHELGHAGHFMLANRKHSLFGCETSLYQVEAPSTCHEMLLTGSLLRQNADPRFQRGVLSSMIQNTYYHNFVTHLLEAAFQREVYRRVDQGECLQANDLNAIKRGMLEQFWGDAVELDAGAELTWMRQPHYYMGLYSYTYSAGLTIATEVSRRILQEGEPAVRDWLAALQAGGTVSPVEFAALAGVDITTEQPLRRTIAYIGEIVDRIAALD